jgi:hypothetical protein
MKQDNISDLKVSLKLLNPASLLICVAVSKGKSYYDFVSKSILFETFLLFRAETEYLVTN